MNSRKTNASKKKECIILFVLLMAFLLAGCTCFVGTPEREYTLMNSAVSIGSSSNLFYIPNEIIENTDDAKIYAFCDDLLISSYTFDEKLQPTSINLKRISLADGKLIGEANIPCGGTVNVQVFDNATSVTDPVDGKVTVLNDRLIVTEVYTFDNSDNYQSYFNNDTKKLYLINDNGVYSLDLLSKEARAILSDVTETNVCGISDDYVVLTYIDLISEMCRGASLSLKSGKLEESPIPGELWSDSFRSGENWILRGILTDGNYILHTQNGDKTLLRNEIYNDLLFTSHSRLLTVDLSGIDIHLYALDGSYISNCALPKNGGYYTLRNMIWNEHWNGFFFIEYEGNNESLGNTCKLLFWDLCEECRGTTLKLESVQGNTVFGGKSADSKLYERAANLSERYGVYIRIADQCRLDYGEFTADEANDSKAVSVALEHLEKALERYPKGFFQQLSYGNTSSVQIELVTNLISPAEMPNTVAFSREEGDHSLIVMDISAAAEWEFYHEVSHIIDKRLEWDARLRSEAFYSKDGWLALQPKGFEYAYSYTDIPDTTSKYDDSEYFVKPYAMTFPTEDRAAIMEVAMSGYFDTEKGSILWKKLDYYRRSIRDCFDTTGWPEVTAWEEALQ